MAPLPVTLRMTFKVTFANRNRLRIAKNLCQQVQQQTTTLMAVDVGRSQIQSS